MSSLDLEKHLVEKTNRRTVIGTGAKIAYASPLIAASFKLSMTGAAAVSPGGECETFACGGGLCFSGEGYVCACFELVERPGHGICNGDVLCGSAISCKSNDDCGGGTCVTNTCCGLGVQICVPPCGPGLTGIESAGLTASGR